jgi:glycosyltransferase involved in cell wall biosynthesis
MHLGAAGAERLLVSLAGAVDKSAVDFRTVTLLREPAQLVPEMEAAGVPVVGLGAASAADLRWVPRFGRILRTWQPDVVHFHSPLVAAIGRPVVRAMCGRRTKIVSTQHNQWDALRPATRVLNEATLWLDDSTVAVSEAVRESMWQRYRPRTDVVINGVPVDELRGRAGQRERWRTDLGLRDDEVAVCSVANFRATKDHATLLRAAALLRDTHPSVRFFLVGDGALRAPIEELRHELGLEQSVVMLGSRSDAIELLAAADIFCLSSIQEGHPIALMEAMAVGLPVVGTTVGGIARCVRDGVDGLLVEPRQPVLLADALGRLASDAGLRGRMAANSRMHADDFSIEATARQHDALYRAS